MYLHGKKQTAIIFEYKRVDMRHLSVNYCDNTILERFKRVRYGSKCDMVLAIESDKTQFVKAADEDQEDS